MTPLRLRAGLLGIVTWACLSTPCAAGLDSPDWPEELGRVSPARARDARDHPSVAGGARAGETAYRAGLAWLEPVPGRDPVRARELLSALVATRADDRWIAAAAYVLGWMHEVRGDEALARGSFERVVLDAPTSDAATRARAALGRLAGRRGAWGESAAWLHASASDKPVPEVVALRESAIRTAARSRDPAARWGGRPVTRVDLVESGSPTSLAVSPTGTYLVGERKAGRVSLMDASGAVVVRWPLDDVRAVAFDPYGRPFAASSSRVYRLDADGPQDVASAEDFAPIRSLATDGEGGLWILDRRGRSLGRIDPGGATPIAVSLPEGTKLGALANGRFGVVAVDDRTQGIVAVLPDGAVRPMTPTSLGSASGLATDPLGQIAILDERSDSVALIDSRGRLLDRIDLRDLGVDRSDALALAPDGSVAVLDGGSGALVRIP